MKSGRKLLICCIYRKGLQQSIDEPTHREGHTLDHVYFNPYQLSTNHSVINEPMGFTSDHYPIVVQIPRFGIIIIIIIIFIHIK